MSEQGGKKRGQPGGPGGPAGKKKKGGWGVPAKPAGDSKAIPTGAVGILATTDGGRERRAADELIVLLDESFARLGKDQVGRSAAGQPPAGSEGGAKPSSVDALLAAEVAELKDKKKDRFRRHDPQVKCTVFVQFPDAEDCPSPEDVVHDICSSVKATRSLASRHLLRLLPVSQSCFVGEDEVAQLAAKVAAQHFPDDAEPIHFAVEFEHRASDKLKRAQVIDVFAKAVPQPPHKVNLKAPAKTILVQLVRNVCAVSVVAGYRDLLRLNVRSLAEPPEEAAEAQPAAAPAAAAAPGAGEALASPAEPAAAAAAEPAAGAAEGASEQAAGAPEAAEGVQA